MDYDVFISHASEDKEDFVTPLADGLIRAGLSVWYDSYTLKLGDSLTEAINKGLTSSSFGIVVLSPHFLKKQWTKRELNTLIAREDGGDKVILPIWHGITKEDILNHYPLLADKVAVISKDGIPKVIDEIIRTIKRHSRIDNFRSFSLIRTVRSGSYLGDIAKADPITKGQVEVLNDILAGQVTEEALEGFLIVCAGFVDEFGNHRTSQLMNLFKTESHVGKEALRVSLEYVCRWVGGLQGYVTHYPVTIIPPRPAFPLFKIINIHKLVDRIYRVLDSKATVWNAQELIKDYIMRTGRFPSVPIQKQPVSRSEPMFHWCSYEAWENPPATKDSMQIVPEWSDGKLRATLLTFDLRYSSYVTFNKYLYEPIAQDYPVLPGGASLIGVEGSPLVNILEEWDDDARRWKTLWSQT